MATIPIPRSYSQILSEAIGSTLSKLELPSLRKGNPALSILEAASRSDARQSQDIFNLLKSVSLDSASGQALDRRGADEDAPRIPETPTTGPVTITDASFAKIESRIFQGQPAPNVGSAEVYVQDASLFPSLGTLYLGRGTQNFEGPLVYTSKSDNGSYWTLVLSTPTQKYHNLGETVVVAQGGTRIVPAGTLVQTSQGNSATAVQYSTIFSVTLPDGESQIKNVQVVCKQSGIVGNTIAGGLNAFVTPPFAGATVTNPLPFTNGLATEDDETYKERLRQVKQSRSRGTALAIKTGLIGATALDENRRILSVSVLTREGFPTTAYIDDGTGYEAKSAGVPIETVVDQALGGEQYFQLVQGRPVAKAYLQSRLEAPFDLSAGSALSIQVGGVVSTHSFSAADFRNPGTATAYEVAASINSNGTLGWIARTASNGLAVTVSAKADINEDIEVASFGDPLLDANLRLGFPLGRSDTLRLYKNDRLLSKDGTLATTISNPQGAWGLLTSPESLTISVDGISLAPILFTDQDFVEAGTPYNTLATSNTLESWVSVLNSKIPGVTASITGGALALTSNLGRNSRSKIEIGGASSLVTKGMFQAVVVSGKNKDYTLDRNLGQIRIEDRLVAKENDSISAGTVATRGFIESQLASTVVFGNTSTSVSGQNGAEFWFSIDGTARAIKAGASGSSLVFSSVNIPSWGDRVTITGTGLVFGNVLPGDWIVITDESLPVANRGAWRVTTATPTTISFERPVGVAVSGTFNISSGGISFARTDALVQRVHIPYNTGAAYTATSLVPIFNSQLTGATAEVYKTNQIRIRTHTFDETGEVFLVAANTEGLRLGFPVASSAKNETSHIASQISSRLFGTPQFTNYTTISAPTPTSLVMSSAGIEPDDVLVALRPSSPLNDSRYGNVGFQTSIENLVTSTNISLRREPLKEWAGANRLYASRPFDFSSRDTLAVLVDEDTTSKRFVQPFFRNLTPSSSSYGIVNTFKDKDNGDSSLAKVFGTGMNWEDFAVHMKSRGKSHRIAGIDTNQTILWKYYRMGPEGDSARIRYVYPSTPNAIVQARIDNLSEFSTVNVQLASGAPRTGSVTRNSTFVGLAIPAAPVSALYSKTYVLNLPIGSAFRTVLLDFNSQTANFTPGETVTGVTSGATGVIATQADAGASGTLTLFAGNNQPFTAGEFLSGSSAGSNVAKATASQYGGVTTLTLTAPPGITDHGLQIGDSIFVTSGNVGFSLGAKNITARTATTVSYPETNTTATGTNIGTVSKDTDGEARFTPSNIIVGDLFKFSSPSMAEAYTSPAKVSALNPGYLTGATPLVVAPALSATLQWVALRDVTNFEAFPLNATSNVITAIATAVNSQVSAPVSANPVGTGALSTGVIDSATFEAAPGGLGTQAPTGPDGTSLGYPLFDGINWVRSHSTPLTSLIDVQFTLKMATEPSLAINNDWLNDEIRLVPTTTKNVTDWLNSPGPGGLFANSEIVAAQQAKVPQLASLLIGSEGSVQVQGGSANSLLAVIQGGALALGSTRFGVNLSTADASGLSARQWVRIQNNKSLAKDRIGPATELVSALGSSITLAGTTAWDWATTLPGAIKDRTWQIERQGNFVCFSYLEGGIPSLLGVTEGDVVHASSLALSPSVTATVNVRNQGFFRIVRVDVTANCFWIENPNVFEETAIVHLAFLKYSSFLPGDKLDINSDIWGSSNVGERTVLAPDVETVSGLANNNFRLTVVEPLATFGPAGALGASAGLVRLNESQPSRLYKKIYAIEPNANDATLSFVKFTTQAGYENVSESAGSFLRSLGRLDFLTDVSVGTDAYRYHTGLIAEANRNAYGLESDPQRYYGIVAAGAKVNVEASAIRRVRVGFALRVRTGATLNEIQNQARAAVASAINSSPASTPISISDLMKAAGSVNGVISVSVTSPTFSPGTDLIRVQSFEKPLVLDPQEDISITFIGE